MAFGDQAMDYIGRKKAGLHALGQHIGLGLEREAKMKASWRDRTGATRAAIHGGADRTRDGTTIYLAHGSKVGLYMEEGTGIYGPKGTPITPKNAKALRFKIGGKEIFVKSVKGMKARPIVEPTVVRNIPKIEQNVKAYWS